MLSRLTSPPIGSSALPFRGAAKCLQTSDFAAKRSHDAGAENARGDAGGLFGLGQSLTPAPRSARAPSCAACPAVSSGAPLRRPQVRGRDDSQPPLRRTVPGAYSLDRRLQDAKFSAPCTLDTRPRSRLFQLSIGDFVCTSFGSFVPRHGPLRCCGWRAYLCQRADKPPRRRNHKRALATGWFKQTQ